jgi:hypothetical protein
MSTNNDHQLCRDAVAFWEGENPLACAVEALRNVAADLVALESALFPENDDAIADGIARRVLAGIQNRAEAAAKLVERLEELRVSEAAERDLETLTQAASRRGGAQ